jgi:aquaporin PIP
MSAEIEVPELRGRVTMEAGERRRFSGDSPRDVSSSRAAEEMKGAVMDVETASAVAPIILSEGMLPASAQASTYAAPTYRLGTPGGVPVDVGLLFFRIGSLSLGLDLNVAEFRSGSFYRAILAEFLATALFLFHVVCTVVYRSNFAGGAVKPKTLVDDTQRGFVSAAVTVGAAAQLLIAVQFGTMIAVLVYIISPISGGHINPAITFGLAITRKITLLRGLCYTGAQFGGAALGTVIAASLNWHTFTEAGGAANGSDQFRPRSLIVAELLATCLLVLTVMAATDSKRAAKVIHIGTLVPLALGLAVMAAHLALIPLDGTSINPARSFGPALVLGHSAWRQFWIFVVGPYVGALCAAVVYEGLLKDSDKASISDAASIGSKDS